MDKPARLVSIAAFALLLFTHAVWAQSAPDKVTVGTITLSLNNLPIYVAQEKGFFANENVFAEVVVLNASTRAIPALIGGSIDLSASSAMTTIRAVAKGADLKMVGGLINAPVYDLFAAAKYKTIESLKGSTIGVTGLITSDTILLKEMLKANGLEYPRDYGMIAVGGTSDRWIAMRTGNIAAGILSPPFTFAAEEAGFNNLGATSKYIPNFTQTVFNVRTKWAQEHRALLVRFLRAIVRASHWAHTEKEDTVRIIAKRFKFNDKYSEGSWRYFVATNAIPNDGDINAKGMEKVFQLLVADGTLKPPPPRLDKYVDASYLAEARRASP
ncbi:MAG TPA: ABC transporter substrate-binding protein [Terriglobales bacterium]|nr:ABC transporter substrate-binding protein [Terriglobales bacterium]